MDIIIKKRKTMKNMNNKNKLVFYDGDELFKVKGDTKYLPSDFLIKKTIRTKKDYMLKMFFLEDMMNPLTAKSFRKAFNNIKNIKNIRIN